MEAKPMRTFSNFNGIEVNKKFKMSNENNNLLWMDLSTAFAKPSPEQARLKRRIKAYKKSLKNKASKKFGSTGKRLGVNDMINITNYSDILFYGSLYMGSEN